MSDTHLAGPKNQIRFISYILGAGTVAGLLFYLLLGTPLLLIAVAVAWGVVGIYAFMVFRVIEPAGDAIGRVLVPSGNSTPSVDQHSNIETLVIRGEFAKAADAYRAVIASEPADIVACEQLGQLAIREMKDYTLAVFAYREAEKRSPEPRRQLGYAIILAGIYRDNLKDYGKSMVELRRILQRYPDAPNATRIRSEIEELRALHFEAP